MVVGPIKRIVVDGHLPVTIGGGVLLQWVPEERFPCTLGPLTYTVLLGNSPSDQFQKIGQVVDDTQFLDVGRSASTTSQEVWYAIMTTDKNGQRYFSPPQKLGAVWRKREWLIAREVVRQSKVRLIRRRAGTRGFLLRRRLVGQPCTACTDPDTLQVTDPSCLVCYGTGIVGGYYPPVECYIDQNPEQIVYRLDPTQGMTTSKLSTWNVLAYPPFHTNDFWLDANNGLRYRIQEQVATICHVESIPIIQQLQAAVEPLDNVVYSFPVNCT